MARLASNRDAWALIYTETLLRFLLLMLFER
ncbi:hypothetical protein MITS9508_02673 [Synechococcus sp. MIT S9508]|nr:hypothetical protein MITS9508_02673 [Synechococcus sp. MIT S9508]